MFAEAWSPHVLELTTFMFVKPVQRWCKQGGKSTQVALDELFEGPEV